MSTVARKSNFVVKLASRNWLETLRLEISFDYLRKRENIYLDIAGQ